MPKKKIDKDTFRWYQSGHHFYNLEHTYDSFDVAEVWYNKGEGWVGEVFGVDLEVAHKTLREIKEAAEEYLTRFTTDFQQYLGGNHD